MISFLRFILVLVLGYVLYKVLWKRGPLFKIRQKQRKPHPQKPLVEMKKDPICGTYIPENQALKYKDGGETYYFCSEECKSKFRQMQ